MTTPFFLLTASTLLGQAPGPILPELVPSELPPAFAQAKMSEGKTGSHLEQACTYLDEGLPLCFRIEVDGVRRWFSHAEASQWGLLEAGLKDSVTTATAPNPLVPYRVEDGGSWWQVEALSGREHLLFLRPDWLAKVGDSPVVAAPAKGVVLAWNSGDTENDQIMAVGVKRIFDTHSEPITPRIFKWSDGRWQVWGEAVATPESGALEGNPIEQGKE